MKFKTLVKKPGAPDETKVIEAPSRFAVYEQVRNEGGYVAEINEQTSFSFAALSRFNIQIGTGIKRVEIIHMAKNLAVMLTAGLSISRALSILERQSSNTSFKKVMTGLFESVKKGTSFNEALAKYPKVFPQIFVAMVKAGEESGSLSNSLTVVGLQMERSAELIRKIRGAMMYPIIVVVAVIIVGILMLVYVVPTLSTTFSSLGVALPLATRVIVAISDFMVTNASLVFLGLIAFAIGLVAFLRSNVGGNVVLSIALHVPVVNELVRETYAARASRTISSLLSAGVPVLEALAISKEVVHAEKFARVVTEAEEHVRKGESLSKAFAEHTKLYPILMSDMLSVGEETGQVADMLKQIAEFYEGDVGERTKDLSSIIEPLLMLLIGGAVGVFAVAIIAPIYSLSSAI